MTGLPEQHRTVLQHEFDEALRERDRLNAVLVYLGERLGIPVPGNSGESASRVVGPLLEPDGGGGASAADVLAKVNPAQFYGFTAGRAAVQVLGMAGEGHPMRTNEIYRAIQKGGVTIANAELLARAMKRHKEILRVGRGLWGLRAWYPPNTKEWNPDTDLQAENGEPDDDENGLADEFDSG